MWDKFKTWNLCLYRPGWIIITCMNNAHEGCAQLILTHFEQKVLIVQKGITQFYLVKRMKETRNPRVRASVSSLMIIRLFLKFTSLAPRQTTPHASRGSVLTTDKHSSNWGGNCFFLVLFWAAVTHLCQTKAPDYDEWESSWGQFNSSRHWGALFPPGLALCSVLVLFILQQISFN